MGKVLLLLSHGQASSVESGVSVTNVVVLLSHIRQQGWLLNVPPSKEWKALVCRVHGPTEEASSCTIGNFSERTTELQKTLRCLQESADKLFGRCRSKKGHDLPSQGQ